MPLRRRAADPGWRPAGRGGDRIRPAQRCAPADDPPLLAAGHGGRRRSRAGLERQAGPDAAASAGDGPAACPHRPAGHRHLCHAGRGLFADLWAGRPHQPGVRRAGGDRRLRYLPDVRAGRRLGQPGRAPDAGARRGARVRPVVRGGHRTPGVCSPHAAHRPAAADRHHQPGHRAAGVHAAGAGAAASVAAADAQYAVGGGARRRLPGDGDAGRHDRRRAVPCGGPGCAGPHAGDPVRPRLAGLRRRSGGG